MDQNIFQFESLTFENIGGYYFNYFQIISGLNTLQIIHSVSSVHISPTPVLHWTSYLHEDIL